MQAFELFADNKFPVLLQDILDELWPRGDAGISGPCSHVASSLHDTALTCICGLNDELCS